TRSRLIPNTKTLTTKRLLRTKQLLHPKHRGLSSTHRERRISLSPLLTILRISVLISRHLHIQNVFIITRQSLRPSVRENLTRVIFPRRRPHHDHQTIRGSIRRWDLIIHCLFREYLSLI